jgi:trk system potassium uptake protein TrkA
MKIIIVGGGEVGFQLARHFTLKKNDVILIEKDPERARDVSNKIDCIVINDSATNIDVLNQAGVGDADYFIAVTNFDEVNLICCALAGSQGVYKVARVSNLDYKSTAVLNEKLQYVNLIVNPEVESSKKIVNAVENGAVSDIIFFRQAGLQMRNFLINDKFLFCNKSIREISKNLGNKFLVAGVVRNEEFIIPVGDTTVLEGDNVYFLASGAAMQELYEKLGVFKYEIKKILIVGGGRIGRQVARHFISNNKVKPGFIKSFAKKIMGSDDFNVENRLKTVKIMDMDYDKCKRIAKEFPDIMVINGDISDESIFREENLADFDLIITATPSHELNVLAALYAKK